MRALLEEGTGNVGLDTLSDLDEYLPQTQSIPTGSSTGAVFDYAAYGTPYWNPEGSPDAGHPCPDMDRARRLCQGMDDLPTWFQADMDDAHEAYDDRFVGVAAGAARQVAAGANATATANFGTDEHAVPASAVDAGTPPRSPQADHCMLCASGP